MINALEVKSKAFALRIIKLYKFLKGKHEDVMSKQVLRCGTSIGANVAEGIFAQSADDFISKNSIALKEARETFYWLDLFISHSVLFAKRIFHFSLFIFHFGGGNALRHEANKAFS